MLAQLADAVFGRDRAAERAGDADAACAWFERHVGAGYDSGRGFYFSSRQAGADGLPQFADLMSYCSKEWPSDRGYRLALDDVSDITPEIQAMLPQVPYEPGMDNPKADR